MKCCANCANYEAIQHRGQRYPKGFCLKQFASRVSDGYKIHLSVVQPYDYVCDFHEDTPKPIYAMVENETYLVPPLIAQALHQQGWVFVKSSDGENLFLRRGEQNEPDRP